MPLTPAYEWAETAGGVSVRVRWTGVGRHGVDVLAADCYVKVGGAPAPAAPLKGSLDRRCRGGAPRPGDRDRGARSDWEGPDPALTALTAPTAPTASPRAHHRPGLSARAPALPARRGRKAGPGALTRRAGRR